MDNPRSEKVAIVDEVRERLDGSNAAILTEYRGLTVKDLAGLRRTLRSSGGEYKIYKNTLVRKAASDSGLEGLDQMLTGPTGITFVEGDAAAVAKVLRDFSRTNPLLVIKGGLLGEKVIGASETTALADLPSREVLLAQLAGAIAAPLQQFAGLLQALPRNLAYGLAALRDRLAEGAPVEEAAPEAAAPEAAAPEADVPEAAAPEADVPEAAVPTDTASPEAQTSGTESGDAATATAEAATAAAEAATAAAEAATAAAEAATAAAEAATAASEPSGADQPTD